MKTSESDSKSDDNLLYKPYPVSHYQEQQLKDEVQPIVEFGVLGKVNRSK
jgi:hypothetical protein